LNSSTCNTYLHHGSSSLKPLNHGPPSYIQWLGEVDVLWLHNRVEDDWNNNWNDNENQDNNESWNHTDDWTPGLGNQPQLNTPEWIDWVFTYISLDQIREITGHLFAQNFRTDHEPEHGIPFHVVTPESSIPEFEEEPIEEAQGQWEKGLTTKFPDLVTSSKHFLSSIFHFA
jgi:hypothetical protein